MLKGGQMVGVGISGQSIKVETVAFLIKQNLCRGSLLNCFYCILIFFIAQKVNNFPNRLVWDLNKSLLIVIEHFPLASITRKILRLLKRKTFLFLFARSVGDDMPVPDLLIGFRRK